MTAVLIFEAIDTASAIADAVLAWVVFFAAIGSVLILAAVATGVWGAGVAWRTLRAVWARAHGHTGASGPHGPSCDSRDAGAPPSPARARTAPSWARVECGLSSDKGWWCLLSPAHSGPCVPRRDAAPAGRHDQEAA